jgi:hypothetical protein
VNLGDVPLAELDRHGLGSEVIKPTPGVEIDRAAIRLTDRELNNLNLTRLTGMAENLLNQELAYASAAEGFADVHAEERGLVPCALALLERQARSSDEFFASEGTEDQLRRVWFGWHSSSPPRDGELLALGDR